MKELSDFARLTAWAANKQPFKCMHYCDRQKNAVIFS